MLALLAIGALLRLGFVSFAHAYIPLGRLADYDDGDYIWYAEHLATGQGYQTPYYPSRIRAVMIRPPAFPMLLAATIRFWGRARHYHPVRIANALLNLLTCWIMFLLARQLFDLKVAWVTLGLAVVYPPFIFWSRTVRAEALFFLGTAFLFYFYYRDAPNSLRSATGAGVALGLTCLTRTAMAGYYPLLCLGHYLRTRSFRATGRWSALFSAAFFATLSPWIIRNSVIYRKPVFTLSSETGTVFWLGNNPLATGGGEGLPWPPFAYDKGLDELEVMKNFYRAGFDFIRQHPRRFLELCWIKLGRLWSLTPQVGSPIVKIGSLLVFGLELSLAFWALLWSCRSRWRELSPFWLMMLYVTLSHMFFIGLLKYRLVLDVFLLMFAASGLVTLSQQAKSASKSAGTT